VGEANYRHIGAFRQNCANSTIIKYLTLLRHCSCFSIILANKIIVFVIRQKIVIVFSLWLGRNYMTLKTISNNNIAVSWWLTQTRGAEHSPPPPSIHFEYCISTKYIEIPSIMYVLTWYGNVDLYSPNIWEYCSQLHFINSVT